MLISRTPVRVSLVGGGTDFPEYYLQHGGAVLGTTIKTYVYVTVSRLNPLFSYRLRIAHAETELVQSTAEIRHPIVRECLRFKNVDGFLDISLFADLPVRTGLGSSSSFTVGCLNALHALDGRTVPKSQLAQEAISVEQERLGQPVGSQDQVHAAYGGLNLIRFSAGGISVEPLAVSPANREVLEKAMMLFHTGQDRTECGPPGNPARKLSRRNLGLLKEVYESVGDAARVLTGARPEAVAPELGRLVHQAWLIKRALSPHVTTPVIEGVYAAARAAGAYGGKLLGAGGGGFILLIADPARRARVRRALRGLYEVPLAFDDLGSRISYLC